MERLHCDKRGVLQKGRRRVADSLARLGQRAQLLPRAAGVLELLDAERLDERELTENLVDLEIINRWLGGRAPLLRAVLGRGARTMLDVGSGGADIPRAIVDAARKRGRNLRVVCLDQSEQMIRHARELSQGYREIAFVRADGTRLPFADGEFDVATSAATLHHCEPEPAVAFLRELRRVSAMTPLVADLRRGPLAYAGAHVIGRISRNRLTRNDAPLSVRRAYTPREALELARAAGWHAPAVRVTPWFRMLLHDEA